MTTEKSKAAGYRYKGEKPNPVPEVTGKPKKRKDTKRWCRGKEGVEHDFQISLSHNRMMSCEKIAARALEIYRREDLRFVWVGRHCAHEISCARCGKVQEPFLPIEQCPDLSDEIKAAIVEGKARIAKRRRGGAR